MITPKVRFRRPPPVEEENGKVGSRTSYRIEVLSSLVPMYPSEEEEKRIECMTAWWAKIDEFFFASTPLSNDFRNAADVEITMQPTLELLARSFLSVLFQNQQASN